MTTPEPTLDDIKRIIESAGFGASIWRRVNHERVYIQPDEMNADHWGLTDSRMYYDLTNKAFHSVEFGTSKPVSSPEITALFENLGKLIKEFKPNA